jgi:hypothetical protein
MNDTEKKSPTHRAYYVTDAQAEGKKDDWIELGAAWEHRDSKGFDVVLKAMPIGDFNGRITLRKIEPKKEPAA